MANLSNINNKFLVTTGGDVGIGITAPLQRLHVHNASGTSYVHISNNTTAGTAGSGADIGFYTGQTSLQILNRENDSVIISTNDLPRVTILGGGYVGIGTDSPDRSLDVEGNGMVIIGTGGYTELMLRGQVEGTGTVRNVGAWQFSVRSDVGGDNDDLKLLRFITGSYEGTAIQVRSDTGGVAIGLNNQGYSSQILNVKSGAADNVFYGESTDANCFASFRDNSSTANIEYGAIANAHVFRSDTTEKMRITSDANVTFAKSADSNRDANSIKHADNDFLYILGGSAGVSLNDNGEDTRIILFDNSNIRFDVGSFDEAMTIAGSNGYVGIGTNVPARELHIKAADGAQIKLESTSTGDWSGIDLAAGNGSYSAYWGILDSNGNFFLDVGSNGTDLTVLQNGNVGIGVTAPDYRLDVESATDSLAGAYIQAGKSSQGEIQNTGLIVGSRTNMAAADYMGISFSGYSAVPARGRAAIGVEAINGPGKMDLVFMTRYADDGTQLGTADIKMRIEGGGNVKIKTGSIVIESTSQGIYLGGTSSSNLLSKFDGNQGANGAVWTPTVTTSQLTNPTITSSSGYYQQVGNVVTASFEFTMSNPAVGAGAIIINNLPIAIADTDHVSGCGVVTSLGKTINVWHYTATNQIAMYYYDGNYCGTTYRTVGTVTYWAAT